MPFTFTLAYAADMAYGSKIQRIRGMSYEQNLWSNSHEFYYFVFCSAEADMIMQNEPELLEWPHGLPSISSIDQARFDDEIEKKLHPVTP